MCCSPDVRCFALGVLLSVAAVLQGCGDEDHGPLPTTTTTTMTAHARSPPLSPEAAAEMLNKQYMGFNDKDDTSPLGVTMSWAAEQEDFTKNLYCHPYMDTGCYNGESDCRMSCSLFNWRMINNNYIVSIDFGRPTGYVFNQTMVEQTLGKCSYIFDGASENRYNNGCGSGAGANCKEPGSAYADICPNPTPHTCTANDAEVKGSLCAPYGPQKVPEKPEDYQCFFSGPSLNFPKHDQPDHLREMVKARLANELATQKYMYHNEVVLDERLLIPAIWNDPAVVVPAFVYANSSAQGRAKAEEMSARFSQVYQVGKIPVLGMKDTTDFRPNGPFFVPKDEATSLGEIVA